MELPKFIKNLFPALKQGGEPENRFSTIFHQTVGEFFGISANQNFLKQYKGWVYACVQAISQEVGDIKLRLFRDNKDAEPEEVFDHPLLDLLNKVNPRMTRHDLFEITQSHQELEGNAFWFLAKDKTGVIREIWPLRPDRVTFAQSKENPLLIAKYFYRQKDGRKTSFEPTEIIHFAQFSSQGEYPFPTRGMGTVEAAALAIDTNNFSREWNKHFFLNAARPDVILKTQGKLTPADYERLKRKFESAYRGVEKAHKFLLLQDGLEIDKLTANQKEMDFVRQVIQSRDEILAIFRVPKTVLGIVDDVNRSNAEATNFVFALRTIKPKMQKVVDTLNEFLIPLFKQEENLFFDFVSPVPEDREKTILEYKEGIDRWLTRNEIRAAEGLPPTTGGDNIFGPFNITPIDRVAEEKQIKEKEKPKEKEKKKADSVEEVIKKATKEHVNKLFIEKADETAERDDGKFGLTFNQLRDFGREFMKGIDEDIESFVSILKRFFDEQEKLVKESVRENLKGLTNKEYNLKQVDDLLPSEEGQIALLIDATKPQFRQAAESSGKRALNLIGIVDDPFDIDNPDVQDFLTDRLSFFSEKVHGTNYGKLRTSIQEGIDAQENLVEIEERISDVYERTNPTRIARTETSAVHNFSTVRGYSQGGAEFKEWVNFNPNDDPCLVGGEIVEINGVFSNGLAFPPAHPNCQCGVVPIFSRLRF